ncbi:MAG: chorismate synthase [Spirochaetales bacterium]|nr:chorismate synthase [Spirochaetales bacterium]
MSSTSGEIFKITTFGESHGPGVGVVVEGIPGGLVLDVERIQQELTRRRPGQNYLTTPRKEEDRLEILSGLYEGRTLGTPLTIFVTNTNQRSTDYADLETIYRPSHADYTYEIKYGYRTPHGGGRASVRETIGRVAAGAIAAQILEAELGVQAIAYVASIGPVLLPEDILPESRMQVDESLVRCPDASTSAEMIKHIEKIKKEGDSTGGTIKVIVRGVPPGLGDPVFSKLEADLARACLSIPACKGFESGSGFAGTLLRGSEHNDPFVPREEGKPPLLSTTSNRSGGIQGGISNGMPITLRLAFKPTATIHQEQMSVNTRGEAVRFLAGGRHDPCVLPRAVPIVEAAVHLTLIDAFFRQRAVHPDWYRRFRKTDGR